MAKATRTLKKKTISLISKKATLHVQHTFFTIFFAVVLHDYNFLVTRFMEEVSVVRVLVHFCFHCNSFSPSWPLAFLIFSPPLRAYSRIYSALRGDSPFS